MTDVVVDSCIVAKWVLTESDSAVARRVGADTQAAGGRLIALDLVFAEVGNAIWKRLIRGLITTQEAGDYVQDLCLSPLQIVESRKLSASAMAIASKYQRSFYDALFVALAADLQFPGVTSDEPLYHAVHADFPNIILLRNW